MTGCTQVAQMGGAWNLVVSPDGKTAYAAAFSSGAIQVFDRNPSTGRLTPKQCLTWFPNVPGCTSSVPAIRRPNDIMVSADGKQVYVGCEADAGVPVAASMVTFTRDPSTGLLTFSAFGVALQFLSKLDEARCNRISRYGTCLSAALPAKYR